MKSKLLLLLAAGGFAVISAASAQDVTQRVGVCDPTPYSAHYCAKPDASGNLPITGTFSATLAGFNPTAGATAALTDIVNVSQDVALPSGTDVVITNKGTVTVNLRLQAGAGTAVAGDLPLVAGAATGIHITTATHISAIAPTGSGTGSTAGQLQIQGGSGLASGYGSGSSSGSGGAVTVADGADTTLGAKADAKSAATDTTPITAMQVLKQISASVQAPPSQAVTNAGTFATQDTQAGTWTVQPGNTANTTAWKVDGSAVTQPVSIATAPVLVAGSALIGKVGIDQTTPGTTNGVSPVAAAVGGTTLFTLTAAASTNATNIKASAGSLYHIGVYNNSATLAWVSFYNTAGTPSCGTSIVYQTMIPANSTSGAGAVEDFAVPLNFGTGIGICVATGIAGTGSVAATSYVVNLGFK